MNPELVDGLPFEWAFPAAVVFSLVFFFQTRPARVAARRARQAARS